VLFGNGAGGFAAAVTYASGGAYPGSVTAGDFNADGKIDLAVVNGGGNGNLGVLLNAGQYQPAVRGLDSPHAIRFSVQTRGFGAGQLVEGDG